MTEKELTTNPSQEVNKTKINQEPPNDMTTVPVEPPEETTDEKIAEDQTDIPDKEDLSPSASAENITPHDPASEVEDTIDVKDLSSASAIAPLSTVTDEPVPKEDEIIPQTPPENTVKEEEHESEDEEDMEEEITSDTDEDELRDINEFSREQLVDILEETVKETDINKIKTRVSLIKVAYLRLNKEAKEQHLESTLKDSEEKERAQIHQDPLDLRFDQAFETYKLNKSKFVESQEMLKQENLAQKQKILEELRELINSEETLKKTYDHFRELQERWKDVGMVPKSEVNNLWQNYHFLVEKFFDKVKINKELKDLDLKKNLEAKIKLCEKTEELLLETSIIRSFKLLQQYHDEWKEIGPVPQDKKDEIWERFKTATDKINERRREHYKKIQEEQQENYTAKLALCQKAEQIVAINKASLGDWQNTTDEMSELLKIWRSIGPASKKLNDKIWERFKTSLDAYFGEKKEYFNKVKEQQIHNYNLKLDLCAQAEALKTSSDWRKTTQDLIRMQKEWKEIGPVPRKHANRIWKRFRAACDEFFERKSAYFSSIQKQEEENLQQKLDLIKRIQECQLSDDKNKDLQAVKEIQREWMDIGHVPIKEKDKLQNDFRTAINKLLDKLKIDSVEISTLTFKARFESVRDYPDANRIISKERGSLLNKLNKLREDISLWENNIGFLAESKNAQILKKEFEKKIDSAKNELIILEAKLKILNGQRS